MKTYAIVYGFAEGPYHGRMVRTSLEQRGLRSANKVEEADVIVAHSIGCLLLPEPLKAKFILLVDPPYWPKRTVLSSFLGKLRREKIDAVFAKKTLFHVIYFIKSLSRMMHLFRIYRSPVFLSHKKVVLVRNHDDTFLEPRCAQELARKYGWQYVQLPGQHDDIWQNPEPYIKLIPK